MRVYARALINIIIEVCSLPPSLWNRPWSSLNYGPIWCVLGFSDAYMSSPPRYLSHLSLSLPQSLSLPPSLSLPLSLYHYLLLHILLSIVHVNVDSKFPCKWWIWGLQAEVSIQSSSSIFIYSNQEYFIIDQQYSLAFCAIKWMPFKLPFSSVQLK